MKTITEPLLRAEQVAEHTQLSVNLIYKLAQGGGMPHYRAGNRVRFRLSEVEEWMRTQAGSDE